MPNFSPCTRLRKVDHLDAKLFIDQLTLAAAASAWPSDTEFVASRLYKVEHQHWQLELSSTPLFIRASSRIHSQTVKYQRLVLWWPIGRCSACKSWSTKRYRYTKRGSPSKGELKVGFNHTGSKISVWLKLVRVTIFLPALFTIDKRQRHWMTY